MKVNSKIGHFNSNFHERRERFASTAKNLEFDNPDYTQKDKILTDVIEDCKIKLFHTFE